MNATDAETLIEAFEQALTSNDIHLCEQIIQGLREGSGKGERPKNAHTSQVAEWSTYLEAILFEERDQDWAKAVKSYRDLLNRPDLSPLLSSQVWLSLSNAYFRQGLWNESIDSAETALALFVQLNRPADQVKALVRMASVFSDGFQQGVWAQDALNKSVACCEQALKILASIPTPVNNTNQMLHPIVLFTLGMAQNGLNFPNAAAESLLESIRLLEQIDNRYLQLYAYASLSDAYLLMGSDKFAEAQQASIKALVLAQEFNDQYQQYWILGQLGLLSHKQKNYSQALAYYEQGAQLVEEIRAGIADSQARADFMALVADEYAHSVLTAVEAGEYARAVDTIELARSRTFLDLLDESLEKDSLSQKTGPLTLKEIQGALPEDALLLEYFTTGVIESVSDRYLPANAVTRLRLPEPKILLFAITQTSIRHYHVNVSPNLIYPSDPKAKAETHFLRDGFRRFLYTHLIRQCEAQIQQSRRTYICPHGPLHNIPFQALLAENETTMLDVEGPEIVYAPSAAILMRNRVNGRLKTDGANQLEDERNSLNAEKVKNACLAIGFNGTAESANAPDASHPKNTLIFAEAEAKLIAAISHGRALVGSEPKKAALIQLAPEYLYLHFSCHGEFYPREPLASTLHLSATETLTVAEVLNDLALNCRLVTLSACESGLNQVVRGDELFGFTRGFLYAGAQAIVATQWRVDERTTHIFTERFCRNIQAAMDIAAALKEAQLYLRNLTKKELIAQLKRVQSVVQLDSPFDQATDQLAHQQGTNKQSGAYPQIENVVPLEQIIASGQADEPILAAHPFYWAPYILICDPDLQ